MFPLFKAVNKDWKTAEMLTDDSDSINLYALNAALIHNADEKNCEAFGAYMFRYMAQNLHKETAFFGLTALAKKLPCFAKSKTFTQAVQLYNQ